MLLTSLVRATLRAQPRYRAVLSQGGLRRRVSQGDQCSNDEIVIFEVTEEIDLRAWRTRRADLERRFRQDEVIIRYSSIGVV
ncbi:hypothetical protein NKI72_33920 [Mesorhizobium sp. M0437]|uniref:hypothetical protein n=1 Tax=Mesorhizobium sp. M0437 TaxID=2956945 RepID=UPI00333A1068